MSFVDKFVAQIVQLEVSLYHARFRLEAETDPEALHDLRIGVRRIRSLLAPLRAISEISGLREAAAEVGAFTTPTRDLEVMISELEARGYPDEAEARRVRRQSGHRLIANSKELKRLFTELDQWPTAFRMSALASDPGLFRKVINKTLSKQIKKLHGALGDSHFDRHELRILIKRTRYLTEAFPELSPLSSKAAKSLKIVQSALGSWHDHHQWCLKVDHEPDLHPLKQLWAEASVTQLGIAEHELEKLARLLPESLHNGCTSKKSCPAP